MSVLSLPYRFKLPATVAAACLLFACSTQDEQKPRPETTVSQQPERWPQLQTPFDPDRTAAINRKVESLLEQMTLAQKVGQMTQGEIGRTSPEDVKKYHLGSVLNGGGGFVNGNKYASVAEWVATVDRYWEASMDTSDGGLAIPVTWGTDAVHGHNKIIGATIFPHNVGLGATRNAELVREISAITAKQVRATGIDWTFSPAISVVRNDLWGRSYEGFSEDPELVARLGRASVLGYQGVAGEPGFMAANRIAATAKHYLADGGTDSGVDRGNNTDSESDLIRLHGQPYFSAIEAGVLSIMASHSSWHGERMHGHRYLLNDILKQRLGFDGVIVGDWNSHGLVEGCSDTRCPQAVNAGMDLLMVPFEWREWIKNTIADVESGAIPMARIDDAVRRILRMKFRAGLMDAPKPSERPYANRADLLDAPEFRQVARQAVRESLVLLKNNQQTLPLAPKQNILVAGPGAHNIPMQAGGWTISWQSTDTTNADFPNATSIYQGIKQAVQSAGGRVELAEDGDYAQRPDAAVVVFGETPYAEWQGDLRHLGFDMAENRTAKMLAALRAEGIPTVAVFLTGRPRWVNPIINAADAFVVAWLPGSEGAGIADLLFTDTSGNLAHDFSGTLPYSWPATPTQTELNLGDADYEPLFPYGYGLSYGDPGKDLPALPSDIALESLPGSDRVVFFDGRARDPWEIVLTQGSNAVRYRLGLAELGPLTVTEADQNTQGDAMNLRWQGGSEAGVEINYPSANRNFEQFLQSDGTLVFDLRLLQPPTEPVYVEMACRGGICNKVAREALGPQLNTLAPNEWQQLSISLNCFAQQDIMFAEIGRAFGLRTAGRLELQVSNIQLRPEGGASADIACR